MSDEREEILDRLNELQAESGIEPETRHVIGILGEAVTALGEEIDTLEQRIEDLEEQQVQEEKKYDWYPDQ